MPIGRRGKVTAVKVEEFNQVYEGEIVELNTMTGIPKNVPLLERVTLDELIAACLMRFGKQPSRVFKFNRTMGPLYCTVISEMME